jgi:hypothetical protein
MTLAKPQKAEIEKRVTGTGGIFFKSKKDPKNGLLGRGNILNLKRLIAAQHCGKDKDEQILLDAMVPF